MNKTLAVTSSPHVRTTLTTRDIMLDVIIALVPALVASVLIFGFSALVRTCVCVASCVLFEYLYRKLMKLDGSVDDLSAVITGLLLAFNLPSRLPLWMAVIGCFIAIVIVKQLFGGLGKNFANPAIVGRIVLMLSFATYMNTWTYGRGVDAVTGATPLETGAGSVSYLQLFIGTIGGSMGETCKLALLIGFIYLVVKRVISLTIPLAFMGTAFLLAFILGQDPLFHLLSGGLMLGAIFMATDYVTTPTTESGKLLFGIGCGIITIVIRLFSAYPEGVSFSILIMNILTPHIDRLTRPRAFGEVKA